METGAIGDLEELARLILEWVVRTSVKQKPESEETHLFRLMLDELKELEKPYYSNTYYVRGEYSRSLD